MLEEYLQWLTIEKGRSRATIDAYRRDLSSLLTWLDERSLDPLQITASDLERYFNELRDTQRSASTVARAVAALRGWFAYLTEEGYRAEDPAARVVGGQKGRTLPKPLSEDVIVRLLESIPAITSSDLRDRALLELLYSTGARVSEVVTLGLNDLDFDEELILLTGKGSKQRLVPMGATLQRVLRDYLADAGRGVLLGSNKSSRVYLNSRGGPLSRQGVDLIVHKRALVAGIDRTTISAHVFRHSCATHMLAHGADIRVVQELLGHSSIATTQLYTAVSVSTLQREYLQAHPRAHD